MPDAFCQKYFICFHSWFVCKRMFLTVFLRNERTTTKMLSVNVFVYACHIVPFYYIQSLHLRDSMTVFLLFRFVSFSISIVENNVRSKRCFDDGKKADFDYFVELYMMHRQASSKRLRSVWRVSFLLYQVQMLSYLFVCFTVFHRKAIIWSKTIYKFVPNVALQSNDWWMVCMCSLPESFIFSSMYLVALCYVLVFPWTAITTFFS